MHALFYHAGMKKVRLRPAFSILFRLLVLQLQVIVYANEHFNMTTIVSLDNMDIFLDDLFQYTLFFSGLFLQFRGYY